MKQLLSKLSVKLQSVDGGARKGWQGELGQEGEGPPIKGSEGLRGSAVSKTNDYSTTIGAIIQRNLTTVYRAESLPTSLVTFFLINIRLCVKKASR